MHLLASSFHNITCDCCQTLEPHLPSWDTERPQTCLQPFSWTVALS